MKYWEIPDSWVAPQSGEKESEMAEKASRGEGQGVAKSRPGGESEAAWDGGGSRGRLGNICPDDCWKRTWVLSRGGRGLPADLDPW